MRKLLPHQCWSIVMLLLMLVLSACSGQAYRPEANANPVPSDQAAPRARPSRVVIGIGAEISTLQGKFEGVNTYESEYDLLSNSPLVVKDRAGRPTPLLAAEMPSQENGTWVVNPDGTMATTWKLRANAKWHDGTPVSPRDFAFALRAYMEPRIPIQDRVPEQYIAGIDAVDASTFVIRWKQPYAFASELLRRQLEPLPAHAMEALFDAGDMEAFLGSSFWVTPTYVGTGPFHLVEWNPGSELTYRAFDDYFLGRPKLDEVVFKIIPDQNAVVANVLAGTIDTTVGITLGAKAGSSVRDQWKGSVAGAIAITPVYFRFAQIQFDPTRLQQSALLDLRVRRAIAQGLDRTTIVEVTSEGTSFPMDSYIGPDDPLFPRVEAAITKYPYDPSRSLALLQEAGWTKRGDTLVDASGQPLALDLRTTQSVVFETEQSIMAADLSKLGMQVTQSVVPQSRLRDNEYRATFPDLNMTASPINPPLSFSTSSSEQCASTERKFVGFNRGCWLNPDYDRWYRQATTALRPAERDDATVELLKVITGDLGIIGIGADTEVVAIRKGLSGPQGRYPGQGGGTWNIQDWHWE